MMQINDKFFSFPPHLSIAWENVAALNLNPNGQLVFHLTNGDSIALPHLPPSHLDLIFKAHATFLEKQVLKEPLQMKERLLPLLGELPPGASAVRFAFGPMEGMSSSMQHNPAQSQAPNLPEEMLSKIAEVTRILAPVEPQELPKAEPHCNCFHCQIARAIHGIKPKEEPPLLIEEDISPKDLSFQQWEITQTGDKLYTVANKLDQLEKYSVYLGQPVGCTCGKQGCEHIQEVLRS